LCGTFAWTCNAAAQDSLFQGRRYALVIGANHGNADDQPLRYALRDARRVADTLSEVGGFAKGDIELLQEPNAQGVRDAYQKLRQRIEQNGRNKTLLLVFYSGHADALAMHLGGSSLAWVELRKLIQDAQADVRLMIVDACRSGRATQVKGSHFVQAASQPQIGDSPLQGFAILSSATAGEDAQESDDLKASFFTHHLLSALQGAADTNRDGQISLQEAYRYTADRTIASTASTLAGVQHPTYRYDIRGRTDVILTQP